MSARNRHLLALTLATALTSPLALAQPNNTAVDATGRAAVPTAEQAVPETPPPALPRRGSNSASEALLNTNAPIPPQPSNEDAPPPDSEIEEAAMNPPRARDKEAVDGAERAAKARSTWKQMDLDGDGRISAAEGRFDTQFSAGFGEMDSNKDGFISEAEFRAQAGRDGNDDGGTENDD